MNEATPLVSTLIPVHNGEAFIGEAIASVLAQTYQPLECIVIDDGSIDRTEQIVRGFGTRVRSLKTLNRGPSSARNAGARVASGEYLAFLDADDTWDPTKIVRQMDLMRRRPSLGLVYCSFERVDANGNHLEFSSAPDPADVLRDVLLNVGPGLGLGSTGLVPIHAFRAIGGFDERLARGQDSDLAWRLAVAFPVGLVPEPLASYRQHAAQIHRDVTTWEHDWTLILRKAFASMCLPPEIQALERRARTNLALTVAYEQRREQPLRSGAKLLQALSLSPLRTTRLIARSGVRRLRPQAAGPR